MFRFPKRAAWGLLALGCLAGCLESSGPSVEFIEGTVTLDGQALEGVTVNFSPKSTDGMAAVGVTNAQGVYTLTTMPTGAVGKGAPAGEYDVTLIKSTTPTAAVVSEDDPNYQSGTVQEGGTPQGPKVEHVIPTKYNSKLTSGLSVTVKDGSNKGGDMNFDIKKE